MPILKDAPPRSPSRPWTSSLAVRALATVLLMVVALLPAPASAAVAGPGGGPPRGFVVLADVDPTILHDIRYRTNHNFVGRPITGYREPLCILTRQAASALRRAQATLRPRGYTLKVYDCYRPQRAVDDFARWAERAHDVRMKREFYPSVDKSRLFEDGYIAARSGHSRGSTVDLTLVRLPARAQRPYVPGERLVPCFAPRAERFPDNTVDMGTGFDCFDTLANTLDPRITGKARDNRLLLKDTLEAAGFTNYAAEWWHYTLSGEPYPDTYFDFPVARSAHR
ncbi:M15 family metallopeptidase [Actinomadura sp. HBU206391]|uniref:M15 family metallopeptidase n=1 Tax=Actinomadura sp. HBU206391 TaxID=2731692 RepID=UPI00164EEA63|nr:M15 family metallopeptidase [Actinomadura sp. HBU206391]MBC6463557.1 M15 family metallopeptidase [Actinomadura sp. HBU206391]